MSGPLKRGRLQTPWRPPGAAKGGLYEYEEVEAEFQAEVARLSQPAAHQLIEPPGRGLEVPELAIRTAMLKLGIGPLEWVLDLDHGHRGPEVA